MVLLTIFGCSALLLAAIGIYGLMAYSVEQRTQEIGIRMALGAESHNVRNMVIVQGMRLALMGVVIGIAASFGLSRSDGHVSVRGQRVGSQRVRIVPIVLSAVALLAVWLPARRATRVDPIDRAAL